MSQKLVEIIYQELNKLFLNEDAEPRQGYYISTGGGGKKFTLRQWYIERDHYSGEDVVKDYHVETYGQDLEVAKERAKKFLGYVPEIRTSEVGKITQRLTYQHMPNGQYQGKLFSEVPIKYLGWWIDNYKDTPSYQKIIADIQIFIQEKTKEEIVNYDKIEFGKYAGTLMSELPADYLSWLMKGSNDPIVRGASELELQKRGEIVNGKTKTEIGQEERKQKEEERKVSSQWVGNIGDKVELEVQYVNDTSFDSQWGTTYITRFVDRDGNTIIYKGKQFHQSPRQQKYIDKVYEVRNGEPVEIPNPFAGLYSDDMRRTLPKNTYSIGGERNPDGTMRFHTWGANYSEPEKRALQTVKDLSDAGKLPDSHYIDDKNRLYRVNRTIERVGGFEKGDWILISGTISAHNEYKDEKQTMIQRPNFIKKL